MAARWSADLVVLTSKQLGSGIMRFGSVAAGFDDKEVLAIFTDTHAIRMIIKICQLILLSFTKLSVKFSSTFNGCSEACRL